jgi:class 3 adenylate cyclase
VHYVPPAPLALPRVELVLGAGDARERRFPFHDRVLIGRLVPGRALPPGEILIDDPTVSGRHCSLTRGLDGKILLRDMSRNGTRVDGRRLVPNVEVEVRGGQTIRIADVLELSVHVEADDLPAAPAEPSATVGTSTLGVVTVLVGDIRDYTVLVRSVEPGALQSAVHGLFARLEKAVVEHGGTVKEYQGDAVFAFWEAHRGAPRNPAEQACEAALALHALVGEISRDPTAWPLQGVPLVMDWALATGPVVIDSFGGPRRVGLSMVGGPVVLAFRLEKLASDRTGPILTCPATREMAERSFHFKPIGRRLLKGFEKAGEVFALRGAR